MSNDSNDKTLSSYEDHVQEYIAGTPQDVAGDVKEWLDKAISYVANNGKILELGSAFGRDAIYLENLGYQVQRTDATKAFVELLQKQGYNAKVLNAITDDFGVGYNMVFANAVLLHFTPEETAKVLSKVYASLNENGILAFTVKQGDGEKWTEDKLNAPRYFCYWQADDLEKAVKDAGFEIISLSEGSTKNADWLQVIARKAA